MSEDQPQANIVDDSMKVLDSGNAILVYMNGLGSYTTAVIPMEAAMVAVDPIDPYSKRITDDFTPSKSIYRAIEKFTTGRIVGIEEDDGGDT